MANIFWRKHDMDNQATALKSTKGFVRRPKTSWTLAHKRRKIGPQFLPTLSILFRPQSIADAINVAPAANLNKMALGLSAA